MHGSRRTTAPKLDYGAIHLDLESIVRGERIVYHRGFLDRDRRRNIELHALASLAMKKSDEGLVVLVRRPLGEPVNRRGKVNRRTGVGPGFEYVAIGV